MEHIDIIVAVRAISTEIAKLEEYLKYCSEKFKDAAKAKNENIAEHMEMEIKVTNAQLAAYKFALNLICSK